MARSQFSAGSAHPTAFLNRKSERRFFDGHADALRDNPSQLTVLEVVGLGGTGKTRLLAELEKRAKSSKPTRHVLRISLAATASTTETGPLLALRQKTKIDCLLFDTALLTYWHATGQPFRFSRSGSLARSPVFQALEVSGDVAGIGHPLSLAVDVTLPLKFAVVVYGSVSREYKKRRRYEKNEFEEVDELRDDPHELLRRLPHYLGLDIRRKLQASNHSLIAFYDGYETQGAAMLADDAPWLREFIGTLDRGLHVIATREPLGWPAEDWNAVIRGIPVDKLPDREARQMLRAQLGPLRREIEDRLMLASRGIPFFLRTVGQTYEDLLTRGRPVQVFDLPSSPDDAIPYLIKHLAPEQKRLAVTMAVVQVFDESLFRYLLHSLHLQVDIFEFRPFIKRYFVEEIAPGLYKTHDLLTASVRASDEALVRRTSLEVTTRHLLMRCQDNGPQAPDTVLAIFLAVIAGWRSTDMMPQESVEALIDAGYLLYDAGYWNELASMVSNDAIADGHPIAVICEFFVALSSRRTVGVRRAIELFEHLEPRAAALGRHENSAKLEVAYLSELNGDYGRARKEFARLDARAAPFDPTDRTQLRARLWHADMLIMDGELREGSRLLLEGHEVLSERVPLDWAELVRHRGHAFRFSFALDRAEALYRDAMRAIPKVRSMQGKLQTNLAETYCWCDPARALEAVKMSTELNRRLGNKIELAKCEAAHAIALAKRNDFAGAHEAVAVATEHARAAGYRAGIAFALQAEAVSDGLAGNRDSLCVAFERLRDLVTTLGTYGHLLVAPAWLIDKSTFDETVHGIEWVQEDQLEEKLQTCLGPPA